MTARENNHGARSRKTGRWIAVSVAGLILLAVGVANGHLVYVAVTSQPECVAHAKPGDDAPDSFRAAKPAC